MALNKKRCLFVEEAPDRPQHDAGIHPGEIRPKRAAEIGYALLRIPEVAEAIAHAMADPGQRQGMCNWKNCKNISPGSGSPMRSATSAIRCTIYLSVFCIDQRYYKPVEIAPQSLISDVLPKTAPRTQSDILKEIKQLQKVFDNAPIDALPPAMVAQYRNAGQAKVRANREIAALSHVFNIAREWGLTKKPPYRGVRKNKESPRDYYGQGRALGCGA